MKENGISFSSVKEAEEGVGVIPGGGGIPIQGKTYSQI